MTEKIRISPSVTKSSKDIMSKHGIKLGQAYEQYALLLATHKPMVVAREQELLKREKELVHDIEMLQGRLDETRAELQSMRDIKQNFSYVENEGFDSALRIITKRLAKYAQDDADGKWDLRKMKLKEVVEICNTYSVPYESVLDRVNPSLMRYVEGYTALCL